MAIDINLNNVAPKDVADAHYSDTNNPHGVTVGQIGAQPTLVSGVNIKTINSISLLGSGNISISSTNFANGNLTLDNDRTHDFANKQMTWNNVKQFKLVASVAPPIGEGSFRFVGFGGTSNDRIAGFWSQTGVNLFDMRGNGDILYPSSFGFKLATNTATILASMDTGSVRFAEQSGTRVILIGNGGTGEMRFSSTGHARFDNSRVGIGITAPDSWLHLRAGSNTVAPLKLTAGTNLTTPQNGAFEFDGTNLFFTVGGVRKTVTLT